MVDESTGNITQPSQCSLCGDWHDLEINRLECVAKTTWRSKTGESFTEYTAPQVWSVALCRACRIKSYRESLKSRMRSALYIGLISTIFIVLGGADAWWYWHYTPSATGHQSLWPIALGILGVVALPASIALYFVNRGRLLLAGNLGEVPPQRRGQAFKQAGETILGHLQTGQGGPVYGNFPLPPLPEDAIPRNIPANFELEAQKPRQERLVREMKEA